MKQTQSYPNIMWREIEAPRSQSRNHTSKRRITKQMLRTWAVDEVKTTNCPRYQCPECLTTLPLTYSKWMRDTSKRFSSPTYVCLDCSTNPKYDKAD